MTGKELGITAVKGKLLLTKEIARFLRTSERWVQRHMSDGTFPFPWYPIGERNHAKHGKKKMDISFRGEIFWRRKCQYYKKL